MHPALQRDPGTKSTDPVPGRGARTSAETSGIKDLTGWVSAISGLVGLLSTFIQQIQHVVPGLNRVPTPLVFLGSLILLVIAYVVQKRRFTHKSVLMDPGALVLRAQPENLVGREEDIERLLELLGNSPLVWVVGESGAGKSALLRAGIFPLLEQAPNRLPVYMDDWGADWADGPREALADALNQAMRSQPGNAFATKENIIERLRSMREETRRLPVLMFDQFDDYQLRHRDRFIPQRGSVLTAGALIQQNEFWRAIQELLAAGLIRCLFATRQDTAYGLESVRFLEPATYPLARLRPGNVLPLLQRLTQGGVVARPENGWQQLQRILSHDLEVDGSVLPIQMRVAFRSLGTLEELTPTEYRKQGGLRGLEASDIAYHLRESERYAGVRTGDALKLVLQMVDRSIGNKTVPRTQEELMAEWPADRRDSEKLDAVLKHLVSQELLRIQYNRDTRVSVWLLDHDYLSRGVLELDRRARYWARYLQESAESFYAARGVWRKWRSLLGPMAQFRILIDRVRGRLRYGSQRSYALLSMIRLITATPAFLMYSSFFLVIAYLGMIWIASVLPEKKPAATNKPTPEVELKMQETRQLWDVAHNAYAEKRRFLETVFADASTSGAFQHRARMFIHAAVGVNRDLRDRVVQDLVSDCYRNPPVKTTPRWYGCEEWITELDLGSPQALRYYIQAVEKSKNLSDLEQNAARLRPHWNTLSPQQFAPVFDRLLTELERTSKITDVSAITRTLQMFKLPPDSAREGRAGRRILQLMLSANATSLPTFAAQLKTFSSALNNEEKARAFRKALTTFEQNDSSYPEPFVRALTCAPGQLNDDETNRIIRKVQAKLPMQQSVLSALGELAVTKMNGTQRSRLLETVTQKLISLPEPPCGALASFAAADNIPALIDVIKWPSCPEYDRHQIMVAIGRVKGRDFPRLQSGGDGYEWDFVEWAEQNGFDLKSPPQHAPDHIAGGS